MTIEQPPDRLLLPSEVAKLFGVKVTTVSKWARDGRLRAIVTPGGQRRFLASEVRGLLEVRG